MKLAHLVTLSSSPVTSSCKNLSFSEGSWIFRLANGCSFFFFEREVVQLAGKPFAGLTVDRLAQRTVCALTDEPRRNPATLQEKSRKLAYWQDQTLSRRKLLSSEHEHGCRSSTSPGCDQLSPSCSPVAQNWAAVVIYLFIYLKWAWTEKSKKKKKMMWNSTRVWFLCRFCKWCACLVWIDFCHLANAQ